MVPAVGGTVEFGAVRDPLEARFGGGPAAPGRGRPYFRVAGAQLRRIGYVAVRAVKIGLGPPIWIDRGVVAGPVPSGGRSGTTDTPGSPRAPGGSFTPITLWVMKLRSPTIER